jgi:hypothetical protein
VLDVLKADFVRTARQGPAREHRHHPPRTAERADPGRHAGRPAGGYPPGGAVARRHHSWPASASRGRRHPGERPAAGAGRLAVSFLAIKLAVDVCYALLDPRVQRR